MKKITAKLLLVLFLTAQFYGLVLLFPEKLDSANLTNVSDTLSNNRLSFRGELDAGVAVGSGVIVLETTPAEMSAENTSTGSAALMGNESVKVGNNAPIAIKTIDTASRIVLASGLTNAASTSDPVVATVSAVHTVNFTPVSAVPNGAFRVLIAATTTTNGNDGLPDKNGFDFNSIDDADVSCLGGSGIDIWEPGTATASGAARCTDVSGFHCFECRYSGNGGSGTAATMYIGAPAQTDNLINPSPSAATGRTPGPGGAETYTFRVRHLYGITQSYSTIDETLGTIGVVEAVRVTATVAPTLTFQISGRASGTYCGQTVTIATTYNTAPFGSISTSAFTDIAQQLVVSTNAAGGYAVTASESGLLTAYNVTGAPTIANTLCDAGSCTYSGNSFDWDSTANKGFGYALEEVNGTCVPANLDYDDCGGGSTFCARPFGTTGATIMAYDDPVDSNIAYVCYRIVVSGTQAAGDYENYVIYIATATF